MTFEIKVLNSGKEAIIVPWTPHRADLESANANVPYKYLASDVSLLFSDPKGPRLIPVYIFESLYGSQSVPGSLRELLPGQWFTVRGRKKVQLYERNWGLRELGESGRVDTKIRGFYDQDRGTYSPKNGGTDMHDLCIPLPCQQGNELDVTLERP